MNPSLRVTLSVALPCLLVCGLFAPLAEAVVVPAPTPVSQKEFRDPNLYIPTLQRPLAELGPTVAARGLDLVSLGVQPDGAFFDWRGARWGSLILSQPLLPGDGIGNTVGGALVTSEKVVWQTVRDYVSQHQAQLGVDLAEVPAARTGIFEEGNLVQVFAQRIVDGIPVRDSGLTVTINHGNLILFGLQNWGTINATPQPSITEAAAKAAVVAYLQPFTIADYKKEPHLELIPLARGESVATVTAGAGYEYRLCWVVTAKVNGDVGTWESLVDAATGQLIAFQDIERYAARRAQGGVYPVSNDQRPPDGVEQAGWPMPYTNVNVGGNTLFTDSGGAIGCAAGNAQTSLTGRFFSIFDNCGAINETSAAGDLDLGFGPTPTSTDCTVPAGHSAGDTKAARTAFYELNRVREEAKGHLALPWLDSQVITNTDLPSNCNANWGGTLNFYQSTANCRNTGEIAGIFDHEWGHGLDNNGVNPNILSPGEDIADIAAMTRLAQSCLGRGVLKNAVCAGYGDPCIGTPATGCTGFREADYTQHQSGLPHDIAWIQTHCSAGGGPCGREVHCAGLPLGETAWDLQARDLRGAPYNFDENTALELGVRLWQLGQQVVTASFNCTPAGGGCDATGMYMQLLATDDDNGNLNDGTPHMTAIRGAFQRHNLHCPTPAVVDSGCAGGPAGAPTVTVTPRDKGARVSWTSVFGAARYDVFRTEGTNGCSFGKVKVGTTTGFDFIDHGLQNGRTYYYSVMPEGSNSSCFGRMSACATVVPTPGANLAIQSFGVTTSITGGDGDPFFDNCETGNISFTVENTGTGNLTNVRLIRVTPLTFPNTLVNTPLPVTLAASLADCATATGTFNITAQGMTFGPKSQFEIEVTADELAGDTRTLVITIGPVEVDAVPVASRLYDFETDYSGWTVVDPPFTRESPGANGTNFHLHSSSFLDNQCDIVRSPAISLTANSTLSLYDRYATEIPTPIPYDRANIGIFDLGNDTRTTIVPTGGRLYDLPPGTPNGACVTANQAGWAGVNNTFAITTWNAGATNPGGIFTNRMVQIDAAYGTDPGANDEGFHIDEVLVSNFNDLIPDVQPNVCGGGATGLSINDVSVTEGNAGTTTANFTVTLTPTSSQTVTVQYATADGSATAGSDYVATSGTLTFPPGTATQPIAVTVNGDTQFEANENFFVNLSAPTNATIADAQGIGTIVNDDGGAGATFVTELFHGFNEIENLAAVGGAANSDLYVISQKPRSSYEILVDATSGDIGPTLEVQRLAADGSTVLQDSQPIGAQLFTRSLRFMNTTASEIGNQTIRVRSTQCTTNCGTDDVYNIHALETTYSVPRFNNSGTQITVLLLQNPTDYDVAGNIYFWDTAGTLIGTSAFGLGPKQITVLNTATVAPGVGGSITVANNARFGDLSGKTVALEPSTGFSFDSPMLPRLKVN